MTRRPGLLSSAFFGISCIAAVGLGISIFGPGMWGWIFLALGIFVAASPYIPRLQPAARGVALTAAVIALLGVVLGLLASTMGGSFRLPGEQAFLLFLMCLIGVFGIAYSRARLPEDQISRTDAL